MKKLNFLALAAALVFFSFQTQAQIQVTVNSGVPQAFPYSALVRDASRNLVTDQFINLRISMHSGSSNGPIVYAEFDTTTTSTTGIFSVVVGGGISIQGRFDSIPWTTAQIYQQVEIDVTGGTNFTDMGASQLLSFPYALAAGNGTNTVTYDNTGILNLVPADGSAPIKSSVATWLATGNAGVGSTGFLGTTDNSDFVLKRNNSEGIRIRNANAVTMPGSLGLGGTTAPQTSLDVTGGLTLRDYTVNVSGNYTLNPGNHGLIFLNSSTYPGNATMTLANGLVKGQIIVIVVGGSSTSYGVRFVNNGNTYNTRINTDGGGVNSFSGSTSVYYTEGNSITFLWNGTDWLQIASSITKP